MRFLFFSGHFNRRKCIMDPCTLPQGYHFIFIFSPHILVTIKQVIAVFFPHSTHTTKLNIDLCHSSCVFRDVLLKFSSKYSLWKKITIPGLQKLHPNLCNGGILSTYLQGRNHRGHCLEDIPAFSVCHPAGCLSV